MTMKLLAPSPFEPLLKFNASPAGWAGAVEQRCAWQREKIEPRGDTNRNRLDHDGIAAVVDGQVQDRHIVVELVFEHLL